MLSLNLSAFTNPFFVTPWVSSEGYTWTFAVQGIIIPVLRAGASVYSSVRSQVESMGWATWVGESGV